MKARAEEAVRAVSLPNMHLERLISFLFVLPIAHKIHCFPCHLMSKSDVYSFGVVPLEMMTDRRSMDKNRPNGEHNLVEWARPYLGERHWFYKLVDPVWMETSP
jgi:hypothetical protein